MLFRSHHLVTDGRTIFASPHNVKVIPDVFPASGVETDDAVAVGASDEKELVTVAMP